MSQSEIKRMLSELHDFRKTSLYQHYRNHFQTLFDGTVDQIIEERLKGPEALYTREGWIGEARAARLQITWFDELCTALEEAREES